MKASSDFSYTSISLNAAAYREGDITLEGKKHHVVLIDFNSNGRFDDEIKIRKDVHGANGQLYPQQGDMLLVDPEPAQHGLRFAYDVTSSEYRHNVSKLINIDGRFYDLKISPAGDKLTLTPSTAPLGSVTNPNDGFRAVIYGDKGFLKFSGNKGTPVARPRGPVEAVVLHHQPHGAAEAEQAGRKESREKKQARRRLACCRRGRSSLEALSAAASARRSGPRYSLVAAQATADYKAVKVRKGETVELPFGPPYKPVVTADPLRWPRPGKPAVAGDVAGRLGRRDMHQHDGQRRPAAKARVHHHRPQGQSRPAGQFRVWLRLHLPVLVASTIGAGERVPRPRQDEGRSVRDRPEERQRDPAAGVAAGDGGIGHR